MGTASLCIPFLEALRNHFNLSLIITQPDKPSGRNRAICFSCVKAFALEHQIPFLQPISLSETAVVERIQAESPDLAVVIAYGQWIPPSVYKIPLFRTINVHFSLLPAYRGAAPVQRAIQDGLSQTGVSIFELCSKMDAGPIWKQFPFPINPRDTTLSLWERMSVQTAPILVETIHQILAGTTCPTPQDEHKATHAPMIQKEEGRVDWNLSAQIICNRLRAFTPWPGVFFQLNDRQIKITEAQPLVSSSDCPPGTVHHLDPDSLQVCCGDDTVLQIRSIQPPGKKPMTPFCYSRGNPLGKRLG